MANAGQDIDGLNGFRLHLIRTAAETGGELLDRAKGAGAVRDDIPLGDVLKMAKVKDLDS